MQTSIEPTGDHKMAEKSTQSPNSSGDPTHVYVDHPQKAKGGYQRIANIKYLDWFTSHQPYEYKHAAITVSKQDVDPNDLSHARDSFNISFNSAALPGKSIGPSFNYISPAHVWEGTKDERSHHRLYVGEWRVWRDMEARVLAVNVVRRRVPLEELYTLPPKPNRDAAPGGCEIMIPALKEVHMCLGVAPGAYDLLWYTRADTSKFRTNTVSLGLRYESGALNIFTFRLNDKNCIGCLCDNQIKFIIEGVDGLFCIELKQPKPPGGSGPLPSDCAYYNYAPDEQIYDGFICLHHRDEPSEQQGVKEDTSRAHMPEDQQAVTTTLMINLKAIFDLTKHGADPSFSIQQQRGCAVSIEEPKENQASAEYRLFTYGDRCMATLNSKNDVAAIFVPTKLFRILIYSIEPDGRFIRIVRGKFPPAAMSLLQRHLEEQYDLCIESRILTPMLEMHRFTPKIAYEVVDMLKRELPAPTW